MPPLFEEYIEIRSGAFLTGEHLLVNRTAWFSQEQVGHLEAVAVRMRFRPLLQNRWHHTVQHGFWS